MGARGAMAVRPGRDVFGELEGSDPEVDLRAQRDGQERGDQPDC